MTKHTVVAFRLDAPTARHLRRLARSNGQRVGVYVRILVQETIAGARR